MVWGWISDRKRIDYCELCRKTKKEPPCPGCEYEKPPEDLVAENLEAMELWRSVMTQWRAGGFGLIGLDYAAVQVVARLLGIELSVCTLAKIQALEAFELARAMKKPGE